MADLPEVEGDKKIPVEMLLSDALVLEVMVSEAIGQLSPLVGVDTSVVQFIAKAASALASLKTALDPHRAAETSGG